MSDETSDEATAAKRFSRLVEVVRSLRAPGGCPWDREQTHESLTPYVVEEAHELVEAIQQGASDEVREELGDVLLQVVLHAAIAEEAERFDVGDVCHALSEKLIRRHPHVFGEEGAAGSGAEVRQRWEGFKEAERREKGIERGVLDGVPKSLPALLKALRLAEKAGGVGFDWSSPQDVLAKVREEADELAAELDGSDHARVAEELGDLLFALANLARHLGVDPEAALQGTNAKFVRRFEHVERRLRDDGRSPADADLDEMERLWQEAKRTGP